MRTIQKGSARFLVDFEKTQAYYKSHAVCDCSCCRNLYAQIRTAVPKLAAFLLEFGVDICRPDESGWVETENAVDYLFVGYTVTGKMETAKVYETEIDNLKVTISESPDEWFPNEQTEPCFFLSVSGLVLPWVLCEPSPAPERFFKKLWQ